ncbi:MAG: NADH-dependent flavin oxidoreductase [Sporolactobacillus sp.]
MTSYNRLFEPVKLPNGVRLDNRLAIAPMTTWSANDNGTVSDQELAYYRRRSGFASLFITACIAVSPTGVAFDHQFIGFSEAVLPRLKKLADAVKSKGSKAILQIHHGGSEAPKQLPLYNRPVSASSVPSFSNPESIPAALTEEEIIQIINEFGFATRLAIRAGFDGVEIHGANHYLIQQFVSAYFNRRNDQWGGSLQNRLHFPFAVLEEVQRVAAREAAPSFIIGYRFSPEEMNREQGYSIEDTYQLVDGLIHRGVHYLHVSQNDLTTKPVGREQAGVSNLRLLADFVANRVPLIAAGGIQLPQQAADGLDDGATIIAIGREAIIDPDWTDKVRAGNEEQIRLRLPVTAAAREELVVPERLWTIITRPTGWFPLDNDCQK